MKNNSRQSAQQKLFELMNAATQQYRDEKACNYDMPRKFPNLYNIETHFFLDEKAKDVMFPMDKKLWGAKYLKLDHSKELSWPEFTTYNYIMDVLALPPIPYSALTFGYAVMNDGLERCTFFSVIGLNDGFPEYAVIDPMALMHNKNPLFYIGVNVDQEHIDTFRSHKQNPLERHVRKIYDDAYKMQLKLADMEFERFLNTPPINLYSGVGH